MKSKEDILRIIEDSIGVKRKIPIDAIIRASGIMVDSLVKGGKVLVCGNGGSAGDAQHIAGEFVNRFLFDRKPMACIALTVDSSVLTAIGNDSSFDEVFSKQVEALGNIGDVFVGISTSGNSKNVVKAANVAKSRGMKVVCFLGKGGMLKDIADVAICIDSNSTPRIQESHIVVMHLISEIVEEEMKKLGKI